MAQDEDLFRILNPDLNSPSAQQQIEDAIRLRNIESNMRGAVEYAPESFVQVQMLYVDCKVNGYPVKAFVDTGAQMSIMSKACAERCQILRLVDNRWTGLALGVGTQSILGRIHLCQMQIGNIFFHSSFSILEHQDMDLLLGLDMLRRHQCVLDLKHNRLEFGTTGTVTPFLAEVDVPRFSQQGLAYDEDRELAEALSRSAYDTGRRAADNSASTSMTLSSASQQQATFPEEVIRSLMSNGFSRSAVVEELHRCNGNTDEALATLLSK